MLTAIHPDDFVARHTDIAAVNLACAAGLPHADESEFPKYLALLDTIADAVRRQTERSWRFFKLKPGQFHNSENVFRLYTMEHVFRVQFGIKYDPMVREQTKNGNRWYSDDSSEMFIHGVLSEKRTGSCSSLPTFAIAVGRRLGYPLKLVLVPNHTLYRWDDGKEIFNLQPTGTGGWVPADEYYHSWPHKWDSEDHAMNARTKVWLHSLTPKQEVSKFLCNRALMLRDTAKYQEALDVLAAAGRFNPKNPAVAGIEFDVCQKMPGKMFGASSMQPPQQNRSYQRPTSSHVVTTEIISNGVAGLPAPFPQQNAGCVFGTLPLPPRAGPGPDQILDGLADNNQSSVAKSIFRTGPSKKDGGQ